MLDTVGVSLSESVFDKEFVAETVLEPVVLWVGVMVSAHVKSGLPEVVGELVSVSLGVADGAGLGLPLPDGVVVKLGSGETLSVSEGEMVALGVGLFDCAQVKRGLAFSEPEGVADDVSEPEGDPLIVLEVERPLTMDSLADKLTVTLIVRVSLSLGLEVGVGAHVKSGLQ